MRTWEHSLSKMCIFGVSPRLLNNFLILFYASLIWSPAQDFIASTKMLLELYLYPTIIYLLPLLEVTGNRPVWSVYSLCFRSVILRNRLFILLWIRFGCVSVDLVSCVVSFPLHCCQIWPIAIASVFGKYFCTNLAASHVHEVKKVLLVAVIKAYFVWLKHTAW